MTEPYLPLRQARSTTHTLRGLRYHTLEWGDASLVTAERPPLVMVHGWMDVGASFQFTVDALAQAEGFERFIIAPDWRGFGQSESPGTDSYWMPDYLGDLDALLHEVSAGTAVDLLGHSMGGNIVMSYAGVRPQFVRRLVNLEGFGLPRTSPEQAPARLASWLDQIRLPAQMRSYASLSEVAARLVKNNPRLSGAQAAWLAPNWSRQADDGRWHVLGDPAHKRTNPILYQVDEILAIWASIRAPALWVEGSETDVAKWWGDRYPRADFDARLDVVPDLRRFTIDNAGHMLHHDQPAALAVQLADFLGPQREPAANPRA